MARARQPPKLVGHSMGGAVCVKTCPRLQQRHYKVAGVAVLDVVEGMSNC
jgi:protein phosphatase methylesterase 1